MIHDDTKCGGTAVASILVPNQWGTGFDIWTRARATEPREETPETPPQGRGKALEEPIAKWYEGNVRGPAPVTIGWGEQLEGPEPWMSGSPDRIAIEDADDSPRFLARWGLEVKTATSRQGWGPDGAVVSGFDAGNVIPPRYAVQVLWYLALSGFSRWDVCVGFVPFYADGVYSSLRAAGASDEVIGATLDGLITERRVITVRADPAVSAALLARISAWWHRHVIDGEPPDFDGSEGADAWLFSQHREPSGTIRDADAEDAEALHAWYKAKLATKAAELAEAVAKQQVEAAIGDSLGLAHPAAGIVRWSPHAGSERIDPKKLRAEFPAAAKACTVTGEARRQLDAPRNWTWET